MDVRTIGIAPNPECLKGVVACQCELGRERLLTAPPYKRAASPPCDESKSRYSTAPCARDLEQYKCPISHILVTFKSPLHPNEVFNKVFPANTPIKYVKRKLAKLLSVSNNNLLLTKNRTVLKETSVLSDLKTDALGNLVIDVFTKDSDEFSLSSVPKESYVHELLHAVIPKKKTMPFIAIKFRVRNQNGIFTRSYHSIMKVHEIKKNLAGLFQVDPDNIVLLRGKNPLKDRMALSDLDYDKYGIVEVELLTKNNEKLNFDKLYKEMPINDVLTVMVPFGSTVKQINVEIFSKAMEKPYLGGYRNVFTGTIYHHAYTQTPQKPEKLPPERKSCRDTQTAEEKEKIYDTPYSRSTQMNTVHAYIPNVTDKIIIPKPYETYEKMIFRLNHNHYAVVIQRAFRHHQFRQKVKKWIRECMERIAKMKEENRLEREAMERRLRRDLITKTFPKTREDFDQLYAMVDRWKHAEIARISQLHSKGPKIAEFTLLLDKEVELLRCIEAYRIKVKEDSRKIKEKKFLEEISKPVAWFGRDGKLITMETVEIQKAQKLKELYNSFIREDMTVKERMELLVDLKFALQEFRHPLAEEIIILLDRECDLLIRRCNEHQLEFLRRRIAASVFQLIKTSELNSGVTKCKDIRDYRKMENNRLYFCELCHQVKSYTNFPLNAKMSGYLVCTSCSWKDVTERSWVDMTPYRFILRAVQRDERRRKCWGSLAFVLQDKDIFFIVEKLWHSHSAISECNDVTELRLCRWHVNEDWSPWNCFLVTVQEMKAHLKLEMPEEVYDEELVQKVHNKHKLAKANFEQLITVNKRFTETGNWQGVRAPAVAHVEAVDQI
ncbi:LOW QUALITY PROTEIN: IQ and ubiquitin-like domain-containing protein [Galleria mellonella]|uniref:LOW QUALITY PROTEIN: IQ and ubiquitin-like domain-containing protein n=1 Tax=Galleria mellonella TaxID=7137 RepID=A0ABM3MC77_GALME|nr:LOW QUALITY PROTEIN: IQ and ubiquitin-like domain-containing protein [Galleria mellonella]